MRILGIDPGTKNFGYSIIEIKKNNPELITSGCLNISKISDHYIKLEKILSFVNSLIKDFEPEEMSIESPFYGQNIQTMFKLGRVQGVAIAAGISNNMKVAEYTPRQIKQAITGNGNASKEQVSRMILFLLNIKKEIETFDESDAIAIALTHYFQQNKIVSEKKYNNWNDFIKNNPNKLK